MLLFCVTVSYVAVISVMFRRLLWNAASKLRNTINHDVIYMELSDFFLVTYPNFLGIYILEYHNANIIIPNPTSWIDISVFDMIQHQKDTIFLMVVSPCLLVNPGRRDTDVTITVRDRHTETRLTQYLYKLKNKCQNCCLGGLFEQWMIKCWIFYIYFANECSVPRGWGKERIGKGVGRENEWIFLEKHQLGRPMIKCNMTKTILFKSSLLGLVRTFFDFLVEWFRMSSLSFDLDFDLDPTGFSWPFTFDLPVVTTFYLIVVYILLLYWS